MYLVLKQFKPYSFKPAKLNVVGILFTNDFETAKKQAKGRWPNSTLALQEASRESADVANVSNLVTYI